MGPESSFPRPSWPSASPPGSPTARGLQRRGAAASATPPGALPAERRGEGKSGGVPWGATGSVGLVRGCGATPNTHTRARARALGVPSPLPLPSLHDPIYPRSRSRGKFDPAADFSRQIRISRQSEFVRFGRTCHAAYSRHEPSQRAIRRRRTSASALSRARRPRRASSERRRRQRPRRRRRKRRRHRP